MAIAQCYDTNPQQHDWPAAASEQSFMRNPHLHADMAIAQCYDTKPQQLG